MRKKRSVRNLGHGVYFFPAETHCVSVVPENSVLRGLLAKLFFPRKKKTLNTLIMGNKALEVIMIKNAICILTIFVLVYSSAALAQYGNGQYPESSGSSGGPGGSSGLGGYPGSSPYEGYSGGPGMMDGGSGAVAYPYPGDGYGGMQNPGRNSEFSYEREGFDDRMDYGPSYGGYSKEHMVFGMVFQHIGDDINPRSVKDYCDNPEGMADIVIAKLKEKVGDLQSICAKAGAEETKCGEMVKEGCMRMGQFFP